jgi:hypothetical protein
MVHCQTRFEHQLFDIASTSGNTGRQRTITWSSKWRGRNRAGRGFRMGLYSYQIRLAMAFAKSARLPKFLVSALSGRHIYGDGDFSLIRIAFGLTPLPPGKKCPTRSSATLRLLPVRTGS